MRLLALVPVVHLGVLVLVPGCRTVPSPSDPSVRRTTRPRSTLTPPLAVLGSAEIQSARVRVDNAYDAVARFRPNFLGPHAGADGARQLPVVYVDNARRGGPEVLRSIPVHTILEIRFLTATEAGTWFGPNNPGGAIAVSLRR